MSVLSEEEQAALERCKKTTVGKDWLIVLGFIDRLVAENAKCKIVSTDEFDKQAQDKLLEPLPAGPRLAIKKLREKTAVDFDRLEAQLRDYQTHVDALTQLTDRVDAHAKVLAHHSANHAGAGKRLAQLENDFNLHVRACVRQNMGVKP